MMPYMPETLLLSGGPHEHSEGKHQRMGDVPRQVPCQDRAFFLSARFLNPNQHQLPALPPCCSKCVMVGRQRYVSCHSFFSPHAIPVSLVNTVQYFHCSSFPCTIVVCHVPTCSIMIIQLFSFLQEIALNQGNMRAFKKDAAKAFKISRRQRFYFTEETGEKVANFK